LVSNLKMPNNTGKVPYPPTGYNLSGKPVPVYLYPSKALGGLFATAEDIARFIAAGIPDRRHGEDYLVSSCTMFRDRSADLCKPADGIEKA